MCRVLTFLLFLSFSESQMPKNFGSSSSRSPRDGGRTNTSKSKPKSKPKSQVKSKPKSKVTPKSQGRNEFVAKKTVYKDGRSDSRTDKAISSEARENRSKKPERKPFVPKPVETAPRRKSVSRPLRSERTERTNKTEGTERSVRTERTDRPVRTERTDRVPRTAMHQKPERTERTERTERIGRTERTERPERLQRPDRPERRPERPGSKDFYVWGRRTVEAFLTDLHGSKDTDAKQLVLHLIVDKAGKVPVQLKPVVESTQSLGIKIVLHKSQEDEKWPLQSDEPLNHQRVCLRIPRLPTASIYDALALVKKAQNENNKGIIGVVLDQIQDPRNFGAILRSAAFFGAQFVIYGQDRQAEVSPLVLKTSAGGAFALKLIPVVNLSRALVQLKDAGGWIVGTTLSKDAVDINTVPLDRPYIIIMGNEGKGVRPEVARQCDYLTKISGGTRSVDSLNVSVATGVVLSHFAAVPPEPEEGTESVSEED